MKETEYPSIDRVVRNVPVYAFDKLDGSNIRAVWDRKKGFTKFGTRTELMDASHLTLGEAVGLVQAQEEPIGKILRTLRVESACCYFEYFGEHSFAGVHVAEPHRCVLFDVKLYKQGFMLPKEFDRTFSGAVETAKLLYVGNCNSDFIDSVVDRTLDGMTFEGVVCKTTRSKMSHPIDYFKLKSRDWIKKVHSLYTDPKELVKLL